MTTTLKKLLTDHLPFSGVPYGNAVSRLYSLSTDASGIVVNGDATVALADAGVVRIGVIDGGTRLEDCLAIVSDAFRASSTAKIGFAYVDGVDDSNVPQDDDYFFAALALDAAGRTRANNTAVRPVVLPKDAYLIVTNGGGNAQNVVGVLDVVVSGAMIGVNS
jgi:hypothetical protein